MRRALSRPTAMADTSSRSPMIASPSRILCRLLSLCPRRLRSLRRVPDGAAGRSRPCLRADRSDRGAGRRAGGGRLLELQRRRRRARQRRRTSSPGSTPPTPSSALGACAAERDQADAQLRLLRAGARARGHPSGRGAGRGRRRPTPRPPSRARRGPGRRRSLRSAARVQLRLAQAARRCGGAARCGAGRARGGARSRPCGRAKASRACVPARGPKRSTPPARASPPPTRRSPRSQKAIADATVDRADRRHRDAEAGDAGELVAPRAPIVVVTDLDRAWANVYVDEPIVPRLRARPAGDALHRRRRPGIAGHDQLHLADGPSSRRATCRPRRTAPSSCTA